MFSIDVGVCTEEGDDVTAAWKTVGGEEKTGGVERWQRGAEAMQTRLGLRQAGTTSK